MALLRGIVGTRRSGRNQYWRAQRHRQHQELQWPLSLNPAPEKVRDPKFQESEFFDPRDVVQVKYEMLRRVSVENASVTDAAGEYGVSRPTFYQAKTSFGEAGVAGLVPKKRGPRGPHKLQGEVLAFLEKQVVSGAPIRARRLAALIRQEFDADVHPRTIERALRGKKLRDESGHTPAEPPLPIVAQYETLRLAGLGEPLPPEARSGLVLLLRRGMWGWARALVDASARQPSRRSLSSSTTAACQQSTIVQVFAANGAEH
jgi:transposase